MGVTDVSIRQVAEVANAGPPVIANPPMPVRVANAALVPGITNVWPDVATGAGGGTTLGAMAPRAL